MSRYVAQLLKDTRDAICNYADWGIIRLQSDNLHLYCRALEDSCCVKDYPKKAENSD